MGHIVRIESREQLAEAIGVLTEVPGTWHARGTPEDRYLLLTDAHYKALVKAGIVARNGKVEKNRGKKTTARKAKS